MRIATCWWSAAGRRALPRRLPRPRPARASSSATSRRSSAARCASRRARRSTAQDGRALGAERRRRSLRRWTMSRVLPRTTAFGYYAQNFVGLAERVTDHLADPGHELPRERLWQVRAKQVVLATGAIERPLVFPDNDRPGVMLAVGGADLSQPLRRRRSGRSRRLHRRTIPPMRAALDLKPAGVDDRGDRRPARQADRRGGRRGAGARHRDRPRPRGGHGRRQAARVVDARPAETGGGEARAIPVDPLLMSGGWTPSRASLLAVARQARLRRRDEAFLPGALRAGALGRRLQRHRRAGRHARRGATRRASRRRRQRGGEVAGGATAEGARPAESWTGGVLGAAPGAGAGHDGQGLRRFPERRHRQGHQAGGPRGLPLDRACQALHHDRHGDRPGQDLQHERRWRSPPRRSARPSRRSA